MTAIPLFDVLARAPAKGDDADAAPLARFAEQLVASALADYKRIVAYEETFVLTSRREDHASDLELLRPVWKLYQDWADEAEQVLARALSVSPEGRGAPDIAELYNALGGVRARLTLSP